MLMTYMNMQLWRTWYLYVNGPKLYQYLFTLYFRPDRKSFELIMIQNLSLHEICTYQQVNLTQLWLTFSDFC